MLVLGRNILILYVAVLGFAGSYARGAGVCENVFSSIAEQRRLKKSGLAAPTVTTSPAKIAPNLEKNLETVAKKRAPASRERAPTSERLLGRRFAKLRASEQEPMARVLEEVAELERLRLLGFEAPVAAAKETPRLGLEEQVRAFAALPAREFRAEMASLLKENAARLSLAAGDLSAAEARAYGQFLRDGKISVARVELASDARYADTLFEQVLAKDLRAYVAGLRNGAEYDTKRSALANFRDARLLGDDQRADFLARNATAIEAHAARAAGEHAAASYALLREAGFPAKLDVRLPGEALHPAAEEPFRRALRLRYEQLSARLGSEGHAVQIGMPRREGASLSAPAYLVTREGYPVPLAPSKRGAFEVAADNRALRARAAEAGPAAAPVSRASATVVEPAARAEGAAAANDRFAREMRANAREVRNAYRQELNFLLDTARKTNEPSDWRAAFDGLRREEGRADQIQEWYAKNSRVLRAEEDPEFQSARQLKLDLDEARSKVERVQRPDVAAARASPLNVHQELRDLTGRGEELARLVRRWHGADGATKEELATQVRNLNQELFEASLVKGVARLRIAPEALTGPARELAPYRALENTFARLEAKHPGFRAVVEVPPGHHPPSHAIDAAFGAFQRHFEREAANVKASAPAREEAARGLAWLKAMSIPSPENLRTLSRTDLGAVTRDVSQKLLDAFCGGRPASCPPAVTESYLKALADIHAASLRRLSADAGIPVERLLPRLDEADFAFGGSEARYFDLRTSRVTEEGLRLLEARARFPGRCAASDADCLSALERATMPAAQADRYRALLGESLARDYDRVAKSKKDPAAAVRAEEGARAVKARLLAADLFGREDRLGGRGYFTVSASDPAVAAELPTGARGPYALVRESVSPEGLRRVDVVQNTGFEPGGKATVAVQAADGKVFFFERAPGAGTFDLASDPRTVFQKYEPDLFARNHGVDATARQIAEAPAAEQAGRAPASLALPAEASARQPSEWAAEPKANFARYVASLNEGAAPRGSYAARLTEDPAAAGRALDKATFGNDSFAALARRNGLGFGELQARAAACPSPAAKPSCEEIFATFSETFLKQDKDALLAAKANELGRLPIRGTVTETGGGQELTSLLSRGEASRILSSTHATYAADASDGARTPGGAGRYMLGPKARLEQQLRAEYEAVPKRISELPFALTNSVQPSPGNGLAWIGFRGRVPGGRVVEVKLQAQLLEESSAQQRKTLALLQANLLDGIYTTFNSPERLAARLLDGLPPGSVHLGHLDGEAFGLGTKSFPLKPGVAARGVEAPAEAKVRELAGTGKPLRLSVSGVGDDSAVADRFLGRKLDVSRFSARASEEDALLARYGEDLPGPGPERLHQQLATEFSGLKRDRGARGLAVAGQLDRTSGTALVGVRAEAKPLGLPEDFLFRLRMDDLDPAVQKQVLADVSVNLAHAAVRDQAGLLRASPEELERRLLAGLPVSEARVRLEKIETGSLARLGRSDDSRVRFDVQLSSAEVREAVRNAAATDADRAALAKRLPDPATRRAVAARVEERLGSRTGQTEALRQATGEDFWAVPKAREELFRAYRDRYRGYEQLVKESVTEGALAKVAESPELTRALARASLPVKGEQAEGYLEALRRFPGADRRSVAGRRDVLRTHGWKDEDFDRCLASGLCGETLRARELAATDGIKPALVARASATVVPRASGLAKALDRVTAMGAPEQPVFGRLLRGTKAEDFATFTSDKLAGTDPLKPVPRRIVFFMDEGGLSKAAGAEGDELLRKIGYTEAYIRELREKNTEFRMVVFKPNEGEVVPATWDNVGRLVAQEYGEDIGRKVARALPELKAGSGDPRAGFAALEAKGPGRMADIYNKGPADPRYVTAQRLTAKQNPTAWDVRAFLYNELRLTELYTGNGKTLSPNGLDGVPEYIGINRPLEQLRHAEVLEVPATAERASATRVARAPAAASAEVAEAVRLRNLYGRARNPALADPAGAAELRVAIESLRAHEADYVKLMKGETGTPGLRTLQAIRKHGEVLSVAREVFEGMGYRVEQVLLDGTMGARVPRRALRVVSAPESEGVFSRSMALDAEARAITGREKALTFYYDPARAAGGSFFDDSNAIAAKRLVPRSGNVASFVVLHELKHAQVNRYGALRTTLLRDLEALERQPAAAAARKLVEKDSYEIYQATANFRDVIDPLYGSKLDFDELAAFQKHIKVLEAQTRDAEFIRRHLGSEQVPVGLRPALDSSTLKLSKELYTKFAKRAREAIREARELADRDQPSAVTFRQSKGEPIRATISLSDGHLAIPLYLSKGEADPQNAGHLRDYLGRAARVVDRHLADAELLAARPYPERRLAPVVEARASATRVAAVTPTTFAREAELFSAVELEKAPAPLRAAAAYRSKVERELSDLRRLALNGEISLHQFEERAAPYRRLHASLGAKVENTSFADLLADEEKLLTRRVALAEAELAKAKVAKNPEAIARLGLDAAKARAEHASVSGRWLGEELARTREISASPAAAREARRRTVLGFNEKFFAPFRHLFGNKTFAQVANDPEAAARLRALAGKELVASRRAPAEARVSFERAVGARFPNAKAPEVRKLAADLADAMATGALRRSPAERGRGIADALEAKGWTREQMHDCGNLCLPGLPVSQARDRAIEPSALAREVLLEEELVKATGPGAEQARRYATPRTLAENEVERRPYDVLKGGLEERVAGLRAEEELLARRLDRAVQGREGRPDFSAPASAVEKLTEAHADVKRARSLAEARLSVVKAEAPALREPRPLTPAELRLNDSATAALVDYLRAANLEELRQIDPELENVARQLRANRLNSYEAMQELRGVTAVIEPERNATFVSRVKAFAANRPELAELHAGRSSEKELAEALRRSQALQASTGHADPELTRAVYRDAGLRPAEQALADAVGGAGPASAKGSKEAALDGKLALQKIEKDVETIARADLKPLRTDGNRQLASLATPQKSFEDALTTLDDATKKSVLESAKSVEKGSDEVRLLAVAQKFVAASPEQRETMREIYSNMAEAMTKGEKRDAALQYGVRKMLRDSGFSPSEIDGLLKRTLACFDL